MPREGQGGPSVAPRLKPPQPFDQLLGGTLLRQLRLLRVRAVLLVTVVVFLPLLTALVSVGFETQIDELLRLTLTVLPVAMLCAWWLGWRLVRPIENLRRQILERTQDPRGAATGELSLRSRDEFSDLADAFNALLELLAERGAANEAFVADLAHEFKNPVAAIRACAESLDQGGAVDPQRAARLGRVLQQSSGRLDALVSQLLELARAEAGMVGEQWGTVDVAGLARGVVEALAADERYSRVRFEVQAAAPAPVHGVAGRLESALRNLIDNAASYNEGGGEVTVSVAVEAGQVRVSVRDTGPGIEAADLPRVFERFFTTRGGQRGTGLGLAMVRAVAEAHGGRVTVASEPGSWTRFELSLPA